MQKYTYFYYTDNNVPMCPSEINLEYNPSFSKAQKYTSERYLKWKILNSYASLQYLLECPSVKELTSDWFFKTYCLDIAYDDLQDNSTYIYFNKSCFFSIQNELYAYIVALELKEAWKNEKEYKSAQWYYNTFYYIPLLSNFYKTKVQFFKSLKDAALLYSISTAKEIVSDFKNLCSILEKDTANIPGNPIFLIQLS